MKYLLMIYQNPATWQAMSEEDKQAIMAEVDPIMNELMATGEWVGGEALADVSQSRTVQVRDGVAAVTDGPYLEAKEHLAGYLIVDCERPERAIEIAARWPDARLWAMEVRPLLGG